MKDTLQKYLFPDNTLRIVTVNLDQTWKDILTHQHHPEAVQTLLGELTAASVLLASNLKFEGSLLLQLQGQGAIRLIVVECDSEFNVRATVKLRDNAAMPHESDLQALLNADGAGRFAVILDLKNRPVGQAPYQGIVALEGKNVSDVLAGYMKNSEQLDTRLRVTCDGNHCSGILLQKLPLTGGKAVSEEQATDNWQKACHFLETVTDQEQLSTDEEKLIHRLFWEDNLVKSADPAPVRWHCSCSRDKVANMLRQLGAREVEDIIEEQGSIKVDCEFCGTVYEFDAIQAAQLFISSEMMPRHGAGGKYSH